ncbi:hypothetical protein M2175_004284 [Bradyrhizobium elkanii]|uniref:hypothetical protein n=1 Tax=Bradyrhizobium TaxID=374 RepID=UPI0012FE083A|nr:MULTISPECIES: hypothetical protein [Bradyrhizobium]MCS3929253.1 hypothetical protein [Bradyrhizobium elkanii]MCS3969809.1 hypothetical protein [Bradyrhizobium japonicum]
MEGKLPNLAVKPLRQLNSISPAGIASLSTLKSITCCRIGFVLDAKPCCAAFRAGDSKFNALRAATNGSTQHGGNTPLLYLFRGAGHDGALQTVSRDAAGYRP